MKISYEWLQTFFEDGVLPDPETVATELVFHAFEVEQVELVDGDTVFDIDVLPNRAADSLSHRGVAREIAAIFDIPMTHDPLREHVELVPRTDTVRVSLAEDASCSYYIAAHITGVTVGPSPEWLKRRLAAIGQKSINNVVDATNYVLFELGRPTHVFDAHKFAGEHPHIGTRRAQKGEKMTLLGGDKVVLDESMTLITDAAVDAPVAVGGIKGGTRAEVDEETTDIVIETANFHPTQTRLAAQALRLRTDASTRFENNIADKLADIGVIAVVQLVLDIAGGELQGFATDGEVDDSQPEVVVTATAASRLLGTMIDEERVEDILARLDFSFTREGDVFTVTAPFERRDINLPEDVIEEIGRIYGYNRIESVQLPPAERTPKIHKTYAYAEHIRNELTRAGFTEVYLYSLRERGIVALRNALASDKNYLREDLAEGITEAFTKNEPNMPLLGLYDAMKLFEIGNVFTPEGERTHVCCGVRVAGSKRHVERTREILGYAKECIEHALGISIPELDTEGEILEFDLDAVIADAPELKSYPEAPLLPPDIVYESPSAYPFVLRDIAVWVPRNTSTDEIRELVVYHAGDLLKRCSLFDEFEKNERVSYAFHLVFQSKIETLTDSKVGDIMQSIEDDIAQKSGWEIR